MFMPSSVAHAIAPLYSHTRSWPSPWSSSNTGRSRRAQQLLADLWGVRQAHGTLVGWIARAARALEPVERHIKAALARAWVLHHDEAGVRRAGRVAWAHMTRTGRLTHYASHAKRGHAATDAIGILPDFGGVSVHDGWGRYQRYAACHHALCNVPHL